MTDNVLGWCKISPVFNRCVYAGVAEVSICIHPDAKGKGVGDALMKKLVDCSEKQGFWTLQAGIFPENSPSLHLHKKHGFRVIGRREQIGKMNGIKRIYPFRDQRLIEFIFSLPSLTKLELSRKKRCIREGLSNTIPEEIRLKPDKSFFTEIFRKGYYQESRFVNEIMNTSRAADLGWIQKDVLQNAVERFRYGLNNGLGQILRTFGLELWLRHQN